MLVHDRIWGTQRVDEEVLLESMRHPELKRLDKISQFGLPYRYYPLPQFTRHEHSLGVMLLLRSVNASLEEQLAGLLHDISHTSFSHLVDWVMGDKTREDFQDKNHALYLKNSSLSSLLHKHGFSPERIANHHHYTLLELPAPHLCADRVDYAMREFQDWANPAIVERCCANLASHHERLVFTEKETAQQFAYGFMKLQHEHWGGGEYMLRWQLFSEVLRHALNSGMLTPADFFTNDERVLATLEEAREPAIRSRLALLRGTLRYRVDTSTPTYHFRKKFRFIDPAYLDNDNVKQLSEHDADYRRFLDKEREYNAQGMDVELLT